MNIFKSLSQGNGTISETNITSFLSYLLNSTNELDNSFLILFFDLIDSNLQQNKISDLLGLKQDSLRERILSFSKRYSVLAIPEFAVQKEGAKQFIDVFLKVSTKKDETDVAYVLIENKIKVFSANKEQVSKQFDYFKNTTDYNKELSTYSLMLTTDFNAFFEMNTYAVASNSNSAWLKWTNRTQKDNSVEAILRNLLILEQRAEIQPINPNSQYILKSFIDYIVTEFSNYTSDQRNFSFNGSEEVEKAAVVIENIHYILKRYDNKMIRIFDAQDNLLEIDVLPFLRKINDYYNLGIDLRHATGTPKNTQVLGKDIITQLNTPSVLVNHNGLKNEFPDGIIIQRNFEFSDSDEVEVANVIVDNKAYILKRFGNKMIRVFDENNAVLDIPVLPLLRTINEEYNLRVDGNHPTGTPKNTQVFGKEVIHGLNSRELFYDEDENS